MCVLECEFCPTTIEAEAAADVKKLGKDHLQTEHYDDFVALFAERYSGEQCQNNCGYTYPGSSESIAEFDCPDCGYDHFTTFANRYIFWELKLNSDAS